MIETYTHQTDTEAAMITALTHMMTTPLHPTIEDTTEKENTWKDQKERETIDNG